jgi:hypothetical protein
VIITGNSDFEFHKLPTNLPKSVKALFLQNSFVSDNKFVFTLPIGVEDFRLGVNGNPKYFKFLGKNGNPKSKILVGPLSPTHPIREKIKLTFPTSGEVVDVLHDRMKPSKYDKLAKQYSAVAAVRGNGVDTHRLWESLYRGVPPIVQSDSWWDSLAALYPEVIVVKEWNNEELFSALEESKALSFDPKDIKPLWMPFWEEQISSYLE